MKTTLPKVMGGSGFSAHSFRLGLLGSDPGTRWRFQALFKSSLLVLLLLCAMSGQAQQRKVIGYLPTWANFPNIINTLDLSKLTHINIAFANPNNTGTLQGPSASAIATVVNTSHNRGVKVFMSIGGAGASGSAYQANLNNTTAMNNFVAKLVQYTLDHNLDGIDVDIEGDVLNGSTVTASQYQAFIVKLGTDLRARGKQMTSALAGWFAQHVTTTAANAFDWINIMSYDAAGSWSGPGQHSSYSLAVNDFNFWRTNKGVPASKLVIGVPFYGYGWGTYGAAGGGGRYIPYSQTVDQYGGSINSDQLGSGNNVIYYNGIPTIKSKATFAIQQNTGGIMIWELSQDLTGTRSLLNAISEVFGTNPPIPQAPYGGTARSIPGKIEAEHYDVGGSGTAYSDATAGNTGNVFRTDDVDLEACTDAGAGYNVGWTGAGEWLEYTVNVTAGTYKVDVRVASTATGKSLRIEMDGQSIGTVNVPATGGWQTWQTVSLNNVALTSGTKVMRIFCVTDGFNLNSVTFTAANQAPSVNITSPANNTTFTTPTDITINANASDADGSINNVEFFNGATSLGSDNTAPYSFSWTNVAAGTYTLTARATDNAGATTTSAAVTVVVRNPVVQAPYGGTARNIPGKIEAEDYDTGGEGVSFHDITAGNTGTVYRTDDVDVQATTDAGAGYNLGWTAADEWTEYTVNVVASGNYNLDIRVATTATGKSLRVELDGQSISGNVTLPNTGAWQTWQTVSVKNIALTAGQKVMRIYNITDGFNLNYVSFSEVVVVNVPPTVSVTSPANNATFTAPASITINANAADSDGSVSKVDFYNGSTLLGTDNTSPYSFTWNSVAAGTYSITARATDNSNAVTASAAVSVTVNTPPTNCWNLTWSDEFNGTSLDQSKWSYQTGDGCPGLCGWGNNELEYYTSSTNNVSVSGGNLALTARYEPNYNGTGKNYTSGKIVTSGKFSQKYGRFEAYIKVPSATAVWPAFWMLANNTSWPGTGEIDILECSNFNPTTWLGTLHYSSTSGQYQHMGVNRTFSTPISNAFHEYAVEWTTTEIKWFIDDVLMGTVTKAQLQAGGGNWPFDAQNFYIILNVAVGGNFTGNVTPNNAHYPAAMLVDYVRVYQRQTNCTVTQSPYNGTPVSIPGTIQAENYDLGGEGVAYHDITAGNTGAVYRTDDVDVQASTDAGAGHNLGWTAADEWTEYTVNVTTAGTYNMQARVASTMAGKSFRVEMDGQSIGTINVPNTGAWQTWQTVTVNNITLSAGQKVMRVYNVTGDFNLNHITFAAGTTTPPPPPNNTCSGIPQYVENAGYVAGSKVQNGGGLYECKPYPYTGWCNGASWAYAPGTGASWQDAWTKIGNCTSARIADNSSVSAVSPNPTSGIISVNLDNIAAYSATVQVFDAYGVEVIAAHNVQGNSTLDLTTLPSGIYVVKIDTGADFYTERIVKK